MWTGTEMIVWGGYAVTATGGRYDPATDTWTAISTAGAPSARGYHAAVWTGSEMIVWGGYDGRRSTPAAGTTRRPTAGRRRARGAPPPGRYRARVWTGTEMIVWGGGIDGTLLNTGGRYDPATDSWTATSTERGRAGRRGTTTRRSGPAPR